MSANNKFVRGESNHELVVRDAREMVRFAAEPVLPGDTIKAQVLRASRELKLDYGTTRRAWYGLAGAEIYPTIYNAWLALIEFRHRALRTSPWATRPNVRPADGNVETLRGHRKANCSSS